MKRSSIVAACVLSMGAEAADFRLTWDSYARTADHNIVAFCGINASAPYRVASLPAVQTAATVTLPVSGGDIVSCHLRALRLSDSVYSGRSAPVTVTALPDTVANRPPVAAPGGPYSATLGSALVFNGGASADPEQQPLTYDWNFGDGSAHGTGVRPSHIYNSPGTYTVTLVVHDGETASAPASATVTIGAVRAATNLLVNGNFETGAKAPWTGGGGGMTNGTADVRSGSWAWRVWGNTAQWFDLKQDVAVVAGRTYDFSGWMRIVGKTTTSGTSGRYFTFQVRWYDAAGNATGSATSFGTRFGDTAYTRFSQSLVAPPAAVTGRLLFLAVQTDGTGYIDDLSVVASP